MRQRKFHEASAIGIHAPDAIALAFGEPDPAIGCDRHRGRAAVGIRQRQRLYAAIRDQPAIVRSQPTLLCCTRDQRQATQRCGQL